MLAQRCRLLFLSCVLGLGMGLSESRSAFAHPAHAEEQAYWAQRNAHGFHPNALSRFEVERRDDAVMQHIALRFDIEYRVGDRFVVLVPPWKHHELHLLAPEAELIDFEIADPLRRRHFSHPKGYRNYAEVRASFENWAKEYPDVVKLLDRPLMVSGDGKPFIIAKITKDVHKEHPKRPNIVITGATHGDEHLTTESLLVNIEKLLRGYASNPRFKKMIDRANLYIVPVVSPDSFLRSRRVHGVDPNRVYDYPGDPTPGTKLKSANAMIEFYKEIEPAGVLDFHGAPPKGMIMCPWGYRKGKEIEDSEDHDLHHRVVKAMGKATPGYATGTIWSTIYVAPGSTTDHNYYHHKMLAIVIEIGGGNKSPPIADIPKKAKEVEEATWIFVESLLPETDPEEEGNDSGDNSSSDSSSISSDDSGSDSGSGSDDESDKKDKSDSSQETSESSQADSSEADEDSDDPDSDETDNDEPADAGKNRRGCSLADTPNEALLWASFVLLWFGRRKTRA